PGHERKGTKTQAHDVAGIVAPGATGVIYVTERATANGFKPGAEGWANFGQGAPETGQLPGAAPRPDSISLSELSKHAGEDVNEYAPTTGVTALREAVAKYYNETYRKGKKSQYTAANVCIVPGGRAGLTRVAAVIGDVFVAYTVPEYTSYDQLLSSFKRLVPIPTMLKPEDAYHLNVDGLEEMIHDMGVSALFLSNPHNPTGQVIHGKDLERMVALSRKGTTMILDEFYEQYLYTEEGAQVSAAEFVEDVNSDNVVLINGLTKVVGPETLITALGQSGSFLDGGAPHPLQVAAIPLLDPKLVHSERLILQRVFKEKRDFVVKRLKEIGFDVWNPPQATFYMWLDLSALPSPLCHGLVFFEEALKEKVIVVRNLLDSPCDRFVRLSFGPPMDEIKRGLDGIERIITRVAKLMDQGASLEDVIGRDLKR
ncbi:hypothetical protein BMF94_1770, partial [Rhodotorula taiwanensis]